MSKPLNILELSRHSQRPNVKDIIDLICSDFIELRGDRSFSDDKAILGGIGRIESSPVMILGNYKGKNTKENIIRNFGMGHPEGYRKSLRLMFLAQKFKLPIITFVDTPGAYPGIEAEKRGQSQAIAENIYSMLGLKVPIITIILGEGGSGGALALSIANSLYMMEYSIYSVISPEGCAAILFKDSKNIEKAVNSLKITAKDILNFGIIDGIIKEPKGGAHMSYVITAKNIKEKIVSDLDKFKSMTGDKLIFHRNDKFKNIRSVVEI